MASRQDWLKYGGLLVLAVLAFGVAAMWGQYLELKAPPAASATAREPGEIHAPTA